MAKTATLHCPAMGETALGRADFPRGPLARVGPFLESAQPVEVSAQDSIVLVRAIGHAEVDACAENYPRLNPAPSWRRGHGEPGPVGKRGSLVAARKSWCPDRRDMIWIQL